LRNMEDAATTEESAASDFMNSLNQAPFIQQVITWAVASQMPRTLAAALLLTRNFLAVHQAQEATQKSYLKPDRPQGLAFAAFEGGEACPRHPYANHSADQCRSRQPERDSRDKTRNQRGSGRRYEAARRTDGDNRAYRDLSGKFCQRYCATSLYDERTFGD
jgi:hypothetical protein